MSPPACRVVVVIGVGGMGLATARRLASGRKLILADYSEAALSRSLSVLQDEGHNVETHVVDISDYSSVEKLAKTSAEAGPLDAIIHTAGVSPVMATARQIYEIDLLGTANIIQTFEAVASPGTSLVCISSMAGHMLPLSADLETHLATAPLDRLLQHKEIDFDSPHAAQMGYAIAKRGNHLRVQAAARAWGERGARVNTVSPGVIFTAMGRKELQGASGEHVLAMVEGSAMRRMGTPDDIAGVVAFLAGPESSFITGTDVLVDGGAVAGRRWSKEIGKND